MSKTLASCFSIDDLRQAASRALPQPVADYLEGGADDEVSLRSNRDSFLSYRLVPRFLVDVQSVSLATTVLGQKVSMPVLLGPAALHRVLHSAGELGVARAAAKFDAMQFLSGMASTRLEDVANVGPAARVFQVYPSRDRGLMRELLARIRAARYPAICVSVDVPCGGNRERDRRAGVAMPPRLSVKGWLEVARKPMWALGFVTQGPIGMPNVFADPNRRVRNADMRFDAGFAWQDLEWLLAEWNGQVAIKGLLDIGDVRRAADIGASAVVLSNHGGRQLDSAVSPLVVLPRAADAVGDRVELLIDGGVRRGTDVLKAIALGARACLVARPYLYGLAVAGQAGVEHMLSIFRAELERGLMLLGCRSIDQLDRNRICRASGEDTTS